MMDKLNIEFQRFGPSFMMVFFPSRTLNLSRQFRFALDGCFFFLFFGRNRFNKKIRVDAMKPGGLFEGGISCVN